MSTTNRAFIKAYRHDAAQPGGAGSPPAIVGDHAAARATIGSVVRGSPDPALLRTEGLPDSEQRRPAVDPVSRSGDRPQPRGDRPQLTAEKRPLSSFIPRTEPTDSRSESESANTFRPGTTVASFQWPAVCRTLMLQCGPQLDHVARFLLARADAGHSLIGVLGLFPRIGSTTTALCLASRAGSSGRRTILVDSNFRSPRLASWLEAVPTAGWDEVLKHTALLADAAVHATDDNLDLLALGAKPKKDPLPLVSGLQAAVTAGVLRHAYDLVLVDLGAFFDPVSQPIVLELTRNMGIDAVIAVTGAEPADRRDLATVAENLNQSGCELLGIIENRVAKPQAA